MRNHDNNRVFVLIFALLCSIIFAYMFMSLIMDALLKNLEVAQATYAIEVVYEVVELEPEVVSEPTPYIEPLEVVEAEPRITEEEFEIICRVVAAEARGESFEGQMAVAQVIKDRMEHPNTKQYGGPSVKGVVFKKGQFAKPWAGELEKYPDISRAVEEVFYWNYSVFDEPVLFFYSPAIATNQGPILKYNYVGSIGCHDFHGGMQQ